MGVSRRHTWPMAMSSLTCNGTNAGLEAPHVHTGIGPTWPMDKQPRQTATAWGVGREQCIRGVHHQPHAGCTMTSCVVHAGAAPHGHAWIHM